MHCSDTHTHTHRDALFNKDTNSFHAFDDLLPLKDTIPEVCDISDPLTVGMTPTPLPVSFACSEYSIEIAYLANTPPKECTMKEILFKLGIF